MRSLGSRISGPKTLHPYRSRQFHDMTDRPVNRLALEKSPYLLQHKYNPVDWYPWGSEAHNKAKAEKKVIFLSVGYSTCHWCHVMEHESFENEEVAQLLNENYVSIKVDREERPDVDKLYMTYIQATTKHGGWPMSVFLTPNLRPFFGGTYFPLRAKYGQPGFIDILNRVNDVWETSSDDIEKSSAEIISMLRGHNLKASDGALHDAKLEAFARTAVAKYFQIISRSYDAEYGGFSAKPKFPRPVIFTGIFNASLLLSFSDGAKIIHMAEHSLEEMAKGGLRDHLQGGFHRYSVDKYWRISHFEKMLYDQAQLVISYLECYTLTGNAFLAEVARGTLDYVATQLRHPNGGFYSAEDADSIDPETGMKAEGAFYIWSLDEVNEVIGLEDAPLFCYRYGIKATGNAPPMSDPHGEFNQKNVLYEEHSLSELAQKFDHDEDIVSQKLANCRAKLLARRNTRDRPFLDDKIIVAWNSLMISAFVRAYAVLGDDKYLKLATDAVQFIRTFLWQNGVLFRSFREGTSSVRAFADDYTFLITALLDIYEASGDVASLQWALELQTILTENFWDDQSGGYFQSSASDASVLIRMKEEYDGAEPSPNSYGAMNLMRLYALTKQQVYRDQCLKIFNLYREEIQEAPIIMPHLLGALALALSEPMTIVLAGPPTSLMIRRFMHQVFSTFNTNKFVCYADDGEGQILLRSLGLENIIEGSMQIDGQPTAYVCHGFTCQKPTTDFDEFCEQLSALTRKQ